LVVVVLVKVMLLVEEVLVDIELVQHLLEVH
jgi:hypothetical protein